MSQTYAAINAPMSAVPPGAIAAVCDTGAGGINGKWVAEVHAGGWNGPRTKFDPKQLEVYFDEMPKGELFVSNYFEGKWDNASMKELTVALAVARRHGLPVAHYNFPTSDPELNARVHRIIGRYVTMFAPAWNFNDPGDQMTPDELTAVVSRLAESLRMAERFGKPLAFFTGVETADGRDPGGKLDQLVRIVRAFGADVILWSAKGTPFVIGQVARFLGATS